MWGNRGVGDLECRGLFTCSESVCQCRPKSEKFRDVSDFKRRQINDTN